MTASDKKRPDAALHALLERVQQAQRLTVFRSEVEESMRHLQGHDELAFMALRLLSSVLQKELYILDSAFGRGKRKKKPSASMN